MKTLFLYILLLCGLKVFSQEISGTVFNTQKEPLYGVVIIDEKSGKWTTSNEEGKFSISFQGEYFLKFKLLGMEEATLRGSSSEKSVVVVLEEKTLRLEDVVVTANIPEKGVANSKIILDKYAISQFQSFSLADVLQQLPGQTIEPPKFNAPKVLNMRTAIDDDNNAFGIGYILDDMPLSNDENMQSYNGSIRTTLYSANINSGLDLRTIPASNIEKIEVISGIADAKYGNATTGLVIIERKAGIHPFQVDAKLQGGGQSISVGKGLQLSPKAGKLSLSLDYLNSNNEPVNNLKGFNRLTGSAIWTTERNDSFRNTLSLTLRTNLDGERKDKENEPNFQAKSEKKDYAITLSNRSQWQLNQRWIDRVSLQGGFSYAYTEDYNAYWMNTGGLIVPTATETSLHSGVYTPPQYLGIMHTKGEPFNANIQFSAEKHYRQRQWNHIISAGVGLNYSNNFGEGKIYDTQSAHTQVTLKSNSSDSSRGIRAINFDRYVIASKQLSVYLQDNISYKFINDRTLYANVGFRYENQNGFSSFSPRVNVSYELSDAVKIRGGVGLSTKAPSLIKMFPGHIYNDFLVTDSRTNYYSFNLVQTFVEQRERVSLKPSKSWKYELGMDFYTDLGKIALSAFYDYSYDLFHSASNYKDYAVPIVTLIPNSDPMQLPTYIITGYKKRLMNNSINVNTGWSRNSGVEFVANFNKINAINTSFSLAGTYVYSSNNSLLDEFVKNTNSLETEYLYGIYKTDSNRQDKFSLRLTASYHLSYLGLLISLTAEQFTFANQYERFYERYPYAYVNPQAQIISVPETERTDAKYKGLVRPISSEYLEKRTPIYHNFHLRMTKEMASGLSFSLYVVNFFDYRPKVIINGSTSSRNTPISFGASAKYSF
ncbi:MAG: TonB-dependent receptor [Capnocytophaga sp.]|nr:TonB-dependent receptor [Capnocytophaga sp.]